MASKLGILASSAALALLAMAGTARADITVYTSLAAFQAAVGKTGTDTFDGLIPFQYLSPPIDRNAGSFTYTGTILNTGPGHSFINFVGGGTSDDPFLAAQQAADTMSFSNFSAGVVAAGGNFFRTGNALDFMSGDVTVTASDAGGTVTRTIAPTSATGGSFLGFVSTSGLISFTAVSATNVQRSAGIDNLVLAAAVPEPANWALAVAGLACLALRRRRS